MTLEGDNSSRDPSIETCLDDQIKEDFVFYIKKEVTTYKPGGHVQTS